jgi:hypothetical protein
MRIPHEVNANLEKLALIAAGEGSFATAGRLFGYVQSYHAKSGILRSFGSQVVHDRLLPQLRECLTPDELERMAAQGASLDEEEMVAEALTIAARP